MQVELRGKEQPPVGDAQRPRHSDGVALWIDTRDARTSHRASRHCRQFHFLPTGGGPEKDGPAFIQAKINRAVQDAPTAPPGAVPFQFLRRKGGWRLEALLPAAVLHGFDPEQNPRLGFCYAVRDSELGEQVVERRGGLSLRGRPDVVERAGVGPAGTSGIKAKVQGRTDPAIGPALFVFLL